MICMLIINDFCLFHVFSTISKSFPNDSLISNSMYVLRKKGKRMRKMAQMGQFVMHSV